MKKAFFCVLLALATPFFAFSQTLPIIRTNPIMWVTEEEAAVSIQMIFRGSDASTEVWMEYGIVGVGFNEETDNEYLEVPSSMGFVLEDMAPETNYMVRAVANTYDGIVYGDTVFFTTLSENPVEIVTDYAAPFAVVMAGDPPFTAAWVYGNVIDLGDYDELSGVIHYGKNPNDLNLSAAPYGTIEDEGLAEVFLPDLEWGQVYSYEFCVYLDTGLLCGEIMNFDTPLKYNETTNYDLEHFEVYQGGTCSQYIEFELEDIVEPVNISVEVKSADGNIVFTDELIMTDDEDVEWIIGMSEFVDDFNIDTTFSFVVSFDDGLTNKKLKGLFNFDGKGCIEEMVMDSYIATTYIDECIEKVEFFTSANETDEIEIGIRKTGGGPIVESEEFENGVGYGVIYFDPSEHGYGGINTFKAFLETEHDISDQILHDALAFETNCGEDEEYAFAVINEGDACQYWVSVSVIPACFDSMTVAVKKVGGPTIWEYNFLDECGDVYLFDVNIGWYGEGTYKAAVQLYDGEFAWTSSETFYYDGGACGRMGDSGQSTQIYPNPAKDFLNIVSDFSGNVEIGNLSGATVYIGQIVEGENHFNFDLPSGLYVVNLIGDGGLVKSEKIIIQK